jgi:hypothetical protein
MKMTTLALITVSIVSAVTPAIAQKSRYRMQPVGYTTISHPYMGGIVDLGACAPVGTARNMDTLCNRQNQSDGR